MTKKNALDNIMDLVMVAEWVWDDKEAAADIREEVANVLDEFEWTTKQRIRKDLEDLMAILHGQPGLGR